MKVLVTGGTGFVGSHTVVALRGQDHDVRVLARDPDGAGKTLAAIGMGDAEVVEGDVTDRPSVEHAVSGCDAVLHAAGRYSFDVRESRRIQEVNVQGTEHVLGAAVDAHLDPIVHVSSYVALLPQRDQVLTPDSPVGRPKGAYAASKAAAEAVARRHQEAGAPVVVVQLGTVLGPNDPQIGVNTHMMIGAVKSAVGMRGGGPFVDVRDVAGTLAAAVRTGRGPQRYMATGWYLDFVDLLRIVDEVTGRERKLSVMPTVFAKAFGSGADLVARISRRPMPLSYADAWITSLAPRCDDSRTREELDVEPRDIRATVMDTLRWLAEDGHIQLPEAPDDRGRG